VCCGRGAGKLVRLPALSAEAAVTIRLPGRPGAVGVGPSGVWLRGAAGEVWRVDPDRLRLVATVRVPGGLGAAPGGVAVTTGAVLVGDPASGDRLVGFDRGAVRRGPSLGLGGGPVNAIAAGPSALWVAAPAGLLRVDLAALR
jgi:hypothetical protein